MGYNDKVNFVFPLLSFRDQVQVRDGNYVQHGGQELLRPPGQQDRGGQHAGCQEPGGEGRGDTLPLRDRDTRGRDRQIPTTVYTATWELILDRHLKTEIESQSTQSPMRPKKS